MKIKTIFLTLILLVLIAAATSYAADSDEYPKDWGAISSKQFDGTQCPVLEGKYVDSGYAYLIEDGKEIPNYLPTISYILLHRDVGTREVVEVDKDVYQNNFVVAQDSKSFSITRLDNQRLHGVVIQSVDRSKENFKCINGWVVLKEEKDSGGSESRYSSTIDTRFFSRLSDGSLIFHLKEKIHSSEFLIFHKFREIDYYIRFPSKSDSIPAN